MRRRAFLAGLTAFGGTNLLPAARAVAAATEPVDPAAITALARTLRGAVYAPGSPDYEKLRRGFAAKVDLHPALIAHVVSADDAAAAIAFATARHLPLAVRGGGHSYAGYNSCDGGLVIDLSGLDAITVDAARQTVRVGGGTRSGAIEVATAKTGLATVLGQCPSVGVGGFLLGGGVGPLMSRHGLGCDNMLSAEIVLADGRRITASARDHPDLFWGLRGGGGNFGVVTGFTLQAHPVVEVYAGFLEHGGADPGELLRVLRDLAAAAPAEMTLIATLTPSKKHGFVLSVQVCHAGEAATGEAALAGALRSPTLLSNGVARRRYLDLEQMVPADIPPVYWENRGGFVPRLDDATIGILARAIASGPGLYDELSFLHLHGAVTAVPLPATAFPMRTPGFAYGIASTWTPDAGPARAAAWVDATARDLAGLGPGAYVNVMGREGPASVRRAYGANYTRLAAVKARYDPANLFAINQNIAPAASS